LLKRKNVHSKGEKKRCSKRHITHIGKHYEVKNGEKAKEIIEDLTTFVK